MGLHIRTSRDEHRSDRANNEYSEANSRTSRNTNTVTDDQAEKLRSEERSVVGSKGWQTNLACDVFETVDGRSAYTFSPDGKH